LCCRTASSIWISTITKHIQENHNRTTYTTTCFSNTCSSIRTPNELNISIHTHAQPSIRLTTDFPLRANNQTRMNHPLEHTSEPYTRTTHPSASSNMSATREIYQLNSLHANTPRTTYASPQETQRLLKPPPVSSPSQPTTVSNVCTIIDRIKAISRYISKRALHDSSRDSVKHQRIEQYKLAGNHR